MLLRRLNVYDPIEQSYRSCDVRINSNKIEAVSNQLNEKESEPWVDLAGYFAYPGLIDAHVHLVGLGKSLIEPNIGEIQSLEELECLLQQQHSEIIVLRGFSLEHASFALDKKTLDAMIPDRPVLIVGKCGHVGFVNSQAISFFGLDKFSTMDGSNLSSGLIRERVLDHVRGFIVYTYSQLQSFLKKGSQHFKSFGITSVHTDDWTASTCNNLLPALDEQKDLRIYEHINLSPPFSINPFVQEEKYKQLYRNTSFLNISSFKFILDGSFEGRSAFLKEPYFDQVDEYGVLYYSEKELSNILCMAEKINWTCNFHVIGDGALKTILNALNLSIKESNPLRHRLIHLQMASNEQVRLIQQLGLYISMQPLFYPADKEMAEKRLGKTRLESTGYPFENILQHGIHLSLSTDAPVEQVNPFYNMSVAECFMDRKKAFYGYTVAGATAAFQENKQGRIMPGFFADMFFLKEDLFSLSRDKLAETRPDLLLFNGEWEDINHHFDNRKEEGK